jgi:Fe-Mn family superoxide dismutase
LVLKDPANPKLKGISAQVVEWHHDKHQAGYVKALNQIETEVAGLKTIEASPNYSEFAEIKRRETFNASGMVLHDLYWTSMAPGGAPAPAGSELVARLTADFGSFERWQEEFVATANTPNSGWAILALAPYDRKLHNFACAFHELGAVWGALPIAALDVWEHAYYYDYGPDRASYIASWLRLVNWPALEGRFHSAARSLA